LLSNIIVWIYVLGRIDFSITFKVNLVNVFETLRFALPFFVSYIAFFLISKYSFIILQKHVSLEEIGQFSLAQQIAIIPGLVTIGVTKAIQPNLFSSKSDEEFRLKAQKFDKNYKLLMIWIVGVLVFSIDFIFQYVLPSTYLKVVHISKYLVLTTLVYNFSVVENTILLYKMKSNLILLITISGSVLNILLSNVLIQYYSTWGVVTSMAIAYCLTFILELYFSRKYIKLIYNIRIIVLSLIIILVGLVVSSSYVFIASDLIKAIYPILSFVVLSILIGIQLKKINRGEVI
jgi:O-antigen/teichoic acid export membrane protein